VSPAARLRRFLETLSRAPRQRWPDAFIHHGSRVVLLIALAAGTYLLFPISAVPDFPAFERGMLVEEDIIAGLPFTIRKTSAELTQEREQAAAAVAPVFRYDSTAIDTMRVRVNAIMAHLDSAAQAADPAARLRQTLASHSLPTRDDVVELLRSPSNRAALRRSLMGIVEQELRRGVAHPNELENLRAPQIRVLREGREQVVARDSLLTPTTLYASSERYLPASAPAGLGPLQQLILINRFVPTLRLDRVGTEFARETARQAVSVVKGEVIRGERVVAAREQLTDDDVERLRAYRDRLAQEDAIDRGFGHVRRVTGSLVIGLLVLGAFAVHLFLFRRESYQDMRHVVVLAALFFGFIALAAMITRGGGPVALIPIALPTLIIAVLWDGRLAFTFALLVVFLLGVQSPLAGLSDGVFLLAGGASAALAVRAIRRRAQALALGGLVAGGYAFAVVGLGLLLDWSLGQAANAAMWGLVSGVGSAVFAFGVLPVFESVTRITSDQTLLELADLNRPLLKRLSVEASGTYAHSINVANLAEAAANAIGANPLLVRVGAYYHDVGKIPAPHYFVENQGRGPNPHDELDPATSAAIVRQHVIDGARLVEQDNLPDVVRAFISEHHGTQRIGFFYDRAKQMNPDVDLDPADFSYPGPLPKRVETAIVLLADSVESAAKVLPDPTAERLRGLVDRIVDSKITHGQLADAPLTLADITRIKAQFVVVLEGMYHRRLDYPQMPQPAESAAAAGSDTA
jgi:hypothetical protein